MSAFAKPSTPTKIRSSNKLITPTKSKSMSNISSSAICSSTNCSSSNKILDDINLLLHLETLKRYKDNETILRQKVEEAYKLFEERRQKYFVLVSKYTQLIKLAHTRKVLLSSGLVDLPIELARADAKGIKEKLSSDSDTDYINTTELNKFKQLLHVMEKFENLPMRRSELVELQNATDAIQYSIEAIEIALEKCTTQGLDYFTDTLDMSNYVKLFSEYGQSD